MSTEQKPLGSGYNAETTAAEALSGADLTGKTVVITGGAAGLGLETTRVLAGAGAKVIAAVRSPERAREALAGLPGVEIRQLDLADPASIDAFAQGFSGPLHVLINNAGVTTGSLERDARGYESNFAVNHLGHFQLTARLWPALKQAGEQGGARVISLTSGAHRRSPVVFDDINFDRSEYDKMKAYGQSKTATALFTVALDKRGEAHGVRAFAVHPGVVPGTALSGATTTQDRGAVVMGAPKTIPQGAATTVWCAASPLLAGKGGVYCENGDIAQAVEADKPTPGGVRPWAIDPAQAERLWSVSEIMTGVRLAD